MNREKLGRSCYRIYKNDTLKKFDKFNAEQNTDSDALVFCVVFADRSLFFWEVINNYSLDSHWSKVDININVVGYQFFLANKNSLLTNTK
jgi:hypothetical protein